MPISHLIGNKALIGSIPALNMNVRAELKRIWQWYFKWFLECYRSVIWHYKTSKSNQSQHSTMLQQVRWISIIKSILKQYYHITVFTLKSWKKVSKRVQQWYQQTVMRFWEVTHIVSAQISGFMASNANKINLCKVKFKMWIKLII